MISKHLVQGDLLWEANEEGMELKFSFINPNRKEEFEELLKRVIIERLAEKDEHSGILSSLDR